MAVSTTIDIKHMETPKYIYVVVIFFISVNFYFSIVFGYGNVC